MNEEENVAIKHCNDNILFISLFGIYFICDKLISTHDVDYFRVFSPLWFFSFIAPFLGIVANIYIFASHSKGVLCAVFMSLSGCVI